MKKTMSLLSLLVLAGCLSGGLKADSEQERRDREELQATETLRDQGETAASCDRTREFLAKRPNSVYFLSARLQEGRCLEDAGRWGEAAQVYRDIREKNESAEPGLPALASWRLSFVMEAQGDDFKALAHVLDAEKRRGDLPDRIARVELPSRKAVLSFRLGHDAEGERSFADAEQGLRRMLAQPGPKPAEEWLSRLYLEMGRSQATAVDANNLTRFLRAQQVAQPYLLKAMRGRDSSTAKQAADSLRSNYAKYWNAVAHLPADEAAGTAVALRLKREKQIPLFAEFLKIVREAQGLQPEASDMNATERDFFAWTDVLSASLQKVLYATVETTVLTEESRVLNGLKRGAPPPKSGEKNPDPNL